MPNPNAPIPTPNPSLSTPSPTSIHNPRQSPSSTTNSHPTENSGPVIGMDWFPIALLTVLIVIAGSLVAIAMLLHQRNKLKTAGLGTAK
jgi:hypothetical protein